MYTCIYFFTVKYRDQKLLDFASGNTTRLILYTNSRSYLLYIYLYIIYMKKKKKSKDITGHAQHKHALIIIPIMYIYEYFIFILYAILIIAFQINPIRVIFKYTRTILEIIRNLFAMVLY